MHLNERALSGPTPDTSKDTEAPVRRPGASKALLRGLRAGVATDSWTTEPRTNSSTSSTRAHCITSRAARHSSPRLTPAPTKAHSTVFHGPSIEGT